MFSKTIHELIADLATPTALQAVDTLTELANFDETISGPHEIRQMLNLLDKLFENDEVYFSLIGSKLRNHAMNEVCRATHILEDLLDTFKADERGHYFPDSETIDGPGLYHFITVSGNVTQTIIAEDIVLAAITFGA